MSVLGVREVLKGFSPFPGTKYCSLLPDSSSRQGGDNLKLCYSELWDGADKLNKSPAFSKAIFL